MNYINVDTKSRLPVFFFFITAVVIFASVALISSVYAKTQAGSHPKTKLHKEFSSPDEAIKTLMDALKSDDSKKLAAIFGPEGKGIMSSGDRVADKNEKEQFIRSYEAKHDIIIKDGKKAILVIGNNDWPFPVPIVKSGNGWLFSTKEGKREILNRRMGRNELNVIQACLAYVDAQKEFVLKNQKEGGLSEYAQKFVSDPGKRNGLYWDAKESEVQSPLGPLFASARLEGYQTTSGDKPAPYHGYYYRILTAQGKDAKGGAYSYIVNGKMIGGFALLAYPASYGDSGIMTFMVNHDGTVYQKNLGRNTAKIAGTINAYNPDSTWKVAD